MGKGRRSGRGWTVAVLFVASFAGPSHAAASSFDTPITHRFDRLLDVGRLGACATDARSGVRCWGRGLKDNNVTPQAILGLQGWPGIVDLSVGDQTGCVVQNVPLPFSAPAAGLVWCWGDNSRGQFGNGTTISTDSPFIPNPITDAAQVAVGTGFACALLVDGTVKCWGANSYGQLGDGTTTSRLEPAAVPGLSGVTAIDASGDTACAVAAGKVFCWGFNQSGQLGRGTTDTAPHPVPQVVGIGGVAAIGDATDVSVGTTSACARRRSGQVGCWGFNWQLVLGGSTTPTNPVATVGGISGAIGVAVGNGSQCALMGDGTARCWGNNVSGQLGDGTVVQSSKPVVVSGLSGADLIGAGAGFACAHIPAASGPANVRCWGANALGQLGNGSTVNSSVPITLDTGQGLRGTSVAPKRIESQIERAPITAATRSIRRDCGWSRRLPSQQSFWMFCDTDWMQWTDGAWHKADFTNQGTAGLTAPGGGVETMADVPNRTGGLLSVPGTCPESGKSQFHWSSGLGTPSGGGVPVFSYGVCLLPDKQVRPVSWGVQTVNPATGEAGPRTEVFHGAAGEFHDTLEARKLLFGPVDLGASDPNLYFYAVGGQTPVADVGLFDINRPETYRMLYAARVPKGQETNAAAYRWYGSSGTYSVPAVSVKDAAPIWGEPLVGAVSADVYPQLAGSPTLLFVQRADPAMTIDVLQILPGSTRPTRAATLELPGCESKCYAPVGHPEYSSSHDIYLSYFAAQDVVGPLAPGVEPGHIRGAHILW